MGTLLDAAAFHNGRTGRETLRIACTIAGIPRSRAEELLVAVGLAADAGRRVGGYSLGMRQRLGLAHALVGEPSVLILDEPANGLDPEGIAWIRELLRDFARHGGTVLLSSHLLAEVQATADRLVIIDHGRVIASGTQRSLLAGSGQTLEELFLYPDGREGHGGMTPRSPGCCGPNAARPPTPARPAGCWPRRCCSRSPRRRCRSCSRTT